MNSKLEVKSVALFESIRPFTTILGIAGVYIGGMAAVRAPIYSLPLLIAMVVVFFVCAGSMTFNDYFDREIDKISHPNRAIPSGRLNPKEVLVFSIILFSFAIILSYFINLLCFAIVLFSILVLYFYEVFFKNQGFIGNVVVAFISAMSFTFGGAAVDNPFASLLLSVLTFFLFTGREILKDVQDVKGDLLKRKTLPMRIGEKKAVIVGSIFLIASIILTPFPFLRGDLGFGYLIFIIIVDLLSIYAIIINLNDIRNTERTVSLIRIAAGIGVIAIIFGTIF